MNVGLESTAVGAMDGEKIESLRTRALMMENLYAETWRHACAAQRVPGETVGLLEREEGQQQEEEETQQLQRLNEWYGRWQAKRLAGGGFGDSVKVDVETKTPSPSPSRLPKQQQQQVIRLTKVHLPLVGSPKNNILVAQHRQQQAVVRGMKVTLQKKTSTPTQSGSDNKTTTPPKPNPLRPLQETPTNMGFRIGELEVSGAEEWRGTDVLSLEDAQRVVWLDRQQQTKR
jgi:hypothetical protein